MDRDEILNVRNNTLEEAAKMIPTNWCDPLLTGADKVIGEYPFNCPDVERLLANIAMRIRALKTVGEVGNTHNTMGR